MDRPLRPHDLLWLRPGAVREPDLPSWAALQLEQGLPVVVRRAPREDGRIPAGIRGGSRSRRLAILVAPDRVIRVASPEDLRTLAPLPDRAELAAFRTLAEILGRLPAGTVWGPAGSVGFELATGWPAVTGDSDLDLVLRCPEPLGRVDARALLALCSGLPARCDVQLDTGAGGLALAEWAAGPAQVLLRTDSGPRLVADPWSSPVAP